MRPAVKSVLLFFTLMGLLAAGAGRLLGGGALHPQRRDLGPELIAQADRVFERVGAIREEFDVRAADGALLRGWKVRPQHANGDWVLLLHGVADNRVGTLAYAEFLLRAGYSMVMMDLRAHGASDGPMATYGWKERYDTRAIVDALCASEKPRRLLALGESMGAAIALQSAAVEPRIAGVVAESSFRDLREVSYDYAGLRFSPWLGKTIFRPAAIIGMRIVEREGGFKARDISPEKAVAARPFPILLICGTHDRNIPCRHSQFIFEAATGPKQFWVVSGAGHTGALGKVPVEFERRVLAFFAAVPTAEQRRARGFDLLAMLGHSAGMRVKRARSVKMNRPVEVARGRVSLSRAGVVVAAFPGVAQPADGLAQAHRQLGDGLQALERGGWQMVAVLFPVLGQQQLGIAEDAGKRIIDLVAQDFAEIAGRIVSGKSC
jgi:alpha-beta hydrolase superfamily lysophospholipase